MPESSMGREKTMRDHAKNTIESIDLPDQKDEKGNPVAGEVSWATLKDGEHQIEGKLFRPVGDKPNGELVIMAPGFPGDGVILNDSRFAPQFVKDGYIVFDARHNGLGAGAEKYLNCPEKGARALADGQQSLGQFSFEEWDREIFTAISALEGQVDKIHIVGHSMGAPNTFNALIRLAQERPELVEKIGTVVSLAGAVGQWRENGDWDPDGTMNVAKITWFLDFLRDKGVYSGIDPDRDAGVLHDSRDKMYTGDLSAFKDAKFVLTANDKFNPEHGTPDEYNPISASREFAAHLQEQGLTHVVSKSFFANSKPGKEIHDYAEFQAPFLERLIKTGGEDLVTFDQKLTK